MWPFIGLYKLLDRARWQETFGISIVGVLEKA